MTQVKTPSFPLRKELSTTMPAYRSTSLHTSSALRTHNHPSQGWQYFINNDHSVRDLPQFLQHTTNRNWAHQIMVGDEEVEPGLIRYELYAELGRLHGSP